MIVSEDQQTIAKPSASPAASGSTEIVEPAHQDRQFLEAAIAACALVAYADLEVTESELREISVSITRGLEFESLDLSEAKALFDQHISDLQSDFEKSKAVLYSKVGAYKGDRRKALALMRLACRISASDQDVSDEEKKIIGHLCALLNLGQEEVWPKA